MLDYLIRGGSVMYLILALSVAALGIVLERIIFYVLTRENQNDYDLLEDFKSGGKLREALAYFAGAKNASGRIIHTYLLNRNYSREVLDESVQLAVSREIRDLENRLPVLSAIAGLATLTGLFGTVIGMIMVFKGISDTGGQVDVGILSDGIWQALLTTAFGLLVAIPATAFHHYFENIVEKRIFNMEAHISDMNILFGKDSDSSGNGIETASKRRGNGESGEE